MDRSDQDSRRSFQPMVQRILDSVAAYDLRAREEDGNRILETSKIPSAQPGAASLLHAKWQEEGAIDRLTRPECNLLARAGYRINKDNSGHWVWWREKRIYHLWLMISEEGWNATSAAAIAGAKWKLLGSFSNPVVPYFEGYHITVQDMVREGLTTTLMKVQEHVPEELMNEQFFTVTRDLCDEAIQNMELETDWANDILYRGMLNRNRA